MTTQSEAREQRARIRSKYGINPNDEFDAGWEAAMRDSAAQAAWIKDRHEGAAAELEDECDNLRAEVARLRAVIAEAVEASEMTVRLYARTTISDYYLGRVSEAEETIRILAKATQTDKEAG